MPVNRNSPAAKRSLKPAPAASGPQELVSQQISLDAIAMSTGLPPTEPVLSSVPGPSPPTSPSNPRKRQRTSEQPSGSVVSMLPTAGPSTTAPAQFGDVQMTQAPPEQPLTEASPSAPPPPKKGRTNTPWTAEEEHRLKQMRDLGKSWSEIAKTFPNRTEGSVKKHWYKDMHYAEFDSEEAAALFAAIKEYEANKWKVIGQKLGKPAKACEQYSKQHFAKT